MSTPELYARAFQAEASRRYPGIDAIEKRLGYALAPGWLHAAARVLACPYKVNPPNWQHGRLLYSLARDYLARRPRDPQHWVDIGTAKGFSALVLACALTDGGGQGRIDSIDAVDPMARVARNSVAEVDGYKTVQEFIAPFMPSESVDLKFHGGGSAAWFQSIQNTDARLNIVFVDGKHSYDAVHNEIREIRRRQRSGDIILFDDVQIPSVGRAVKTAVGNYRLEKVTLNAIRAYVIARRL